MIKGKKLNKKKDNVMRKSRMLLNDLGIDLPSEISEYFKNPGEIEEDLNENEACVITVDKIEIDITKLDPNIKKLVINRKEALILNQ